MVSPELLNLCSLYRHLERRLAGVALHRFARQLGLEVEDLGAFRIRTRHANGHDSALPNHPLQRVGAPRQRDRGDEIGSA